uniref:Uncharacterized protein n=1 Tax=Rhizophagus irregularis (strain DAOM 181602 / DAOM 197198 / MUCL 43194) TaxID=747089 RepID=U9UFQ3_RHIID
MIDLSDSYQNHVLRYNDVLDSCGQFLIVDGNLSFSGSGDQLNGIGPFLITRSNSVLAGPGAYALQVLSKGTFSIKKLSAVKLSSTTTFFLASPNFNLIPSFTTWTATFSPILVMVFGTGVITANVAIALLPHLNQW